MSQPCRHTTLEQVEDGPDAILPRIENEISIVSLSQSMRNEESIATPGEVFLCTICVETDTTVLNRALIPECNHTFCLDCLLSWTTIRASCPNCKAPFASLLVHRCENGEMLQGPWTSSMVPPWRLEHITILQNANWAKLREVHTPQHDIETSFSLPPLNYSSVQSYRTAHASSSAPHYLHEEVEDELEERFWQEEEKQYDRLMRRTRVVSNRRFGPKGYIAAGHMQAKARPPARTTKDGDRTGAGSSQAHASMNQESTPRKQGGTGRKKKVKKKSRAGIAAAAAAKLTVEAGASQAVSSMHASSSSEIGTQRHEATIMSVTRECDKKE